MNNRSRKLLDLAHRITDCTNCGRFSPEGCEPAHQNGIDAGKGQSIKGQDNRHAALCHECHAWLDSGGTKPDPSGCFHPVRADKFEMWVKAHLRTFDYYWRQQWLSVR
jgi:hypothetical protein